MYYWNYLVCYIFSMFPRQNPPAFFWCLWQEILNQTLYSIHRGKLFSFYHLNLLQMRTIYPCGLNKGFSLKFLKGYRLWQRTSEEGQRSWNVVNINDQDENNSPRWENDIHNTSRFNKFRHIIQLVILPSIYRSW